jgi:hypothetical protein
MLIYNRIEGETVDFIIDFFRSIDGIPYYIILVVNTILIFAIIGYLGEKNNENLLKISMVKGQSNLKSGTMNLNIAHTSTHSTSAIPTVAATQVENVSDNMNVSNVSGDTPAVGILPSTQDNPNPAVGLAPVNSQPMNINNNQTGQQIIRPEDNEADPNEKVPSVLVINSSDMNNGAK